MDRNNPFEQSEFLLEAINEVKSDKNVSEYDFLDKIEKVHPSPSKKGNAGLSNAYAELAIYEEDSRIVVDKELVSELDSRLAESDGVNERHRFESIVMDSDKRPGDRKSLIDKDVNGHQRLKNRIREFYEATGREEEFEKYADGGLLTQNDISSKSENEKDKGGENMSTERDEPALESLVQTIETTLTGIENRADHDKAAVGLREYTEQNLRWADFTALAEEYEDLTEDVIKTVTYADDRMEGFEDFMNSYFDDVDEALEDFRDYVDFMNDEAYDAASRVSAANDRLGRENGSGIDDILEKYGE